MVAVSCQWMEIGWRPVHCSPDASERKVRSQLFISGGFPSRVRPPGVGASPYSCQGGVDGPVLHGDRGCFGGDIRLVTLRLAEIFTAAAGNVLVFPQGWRSGPKLLCLRNRAIRKMQPRTAGWNPTRTASRRLLLAATNRFCKGIWPRPATGPGLSTRKPAR